MYQQHLDKPIPVLRRALALAHHTAERYLDKTRELIVGSGRN